MDLFPEICISIALVTLVLFILLAIINRRAATSRFSLVLAGICISSFFLFLPAYWATSQDWIVKNEIALNGNWYQTLRSGAYSLVYALKAIAGGQEINVVETLSISQPFFQDIYIAMNYGYFIAAPIMTSGLVLSLVGDLWDRVRYLLQVRRTYHIFSHPNEIALGIAQQIRKKCSKAVLVFCNCKDVDKKLLQRMRKLDGLCLYKPCEALGMPLGKKKLEYYLVDANEDTNLRCAERLIVKHRGEEKKQIVLNAMAASGTGIQVVESMDMGNIGLRFFDGTALLCSNLLLWYPLCKLPRERKTISVVVVGCDRTGMRMVKSLAWCGQIDGKQLKIRVYDQNAEQIRQRFLAQCPELCDHCDITFQYADVRTAEFETKLMDPESGSPDATYCVITVGDDEENMAAAERIYRLYRAQNDFGWTPTILARVRAATKAEVYSGHENAYLKEREIHTFGGVEEALSSDVLFHSALERMSFAVDLCYWGLLPEKDPVEMTRQELVAYLARQEIRQCRQAFLRSEYSRRSSMAAALHISAKLYACGVLPEAERFPSDETAQKFRKALELEPELEERLARNEHLRWNAFMRSEGYRSASWEELERFYPQVRNNQDLLSKRHLCITDWENLEELNRKYLELNPPVRKNFKKSDFDLIRGIPKIIMLANRLDTTGADFDM